MRRKRRQVQRALRLVAVAGVVCGGVMMSQAFGAAPDGTQPRSGSRVLDAPDGARGPADAAGLAGDLAARLGDARTGGSWVDDEGRPVVAVTDEDTAAEVARAGARAEVVRYSMRDLQDAAGALREAERVPGTAWSVDPVSNGVLVLADSTVSAQEWARLQSVADGIGGQVRMERTEAAFTTRTAGAAPILTRGSRCSAGFNVTNGTTDFILTAGHCGPPGTGWFADNQGTRPVGTTVSTSFPGGDFSLVQYQNDGSDHSSVVGVGSGRVVRIKGAADPFVGQEVFRSGSTSGLHSGQVTGLNATVNYPEGAVSGLIQTTVCAEPGDSGGPLFAQGLALGITSGGSGDCKAGGITFFQPVTTAMATLGVSLPRAPDSGDAEAPAAGGGTPGTAPSAAGAPTREAGDGAGGGSGGSGTGQSGQQAAPGVPGAPTAPGGAPVYPGTASDATHLGAIGSGGGIGPGLLIVAVSCLAFLATRWIRPAAAVGGHRPGGWD
ncbi:S1 family peptidase [Actinacidiphila glaucinigra]|uniref:S1 family peptidase n=1 Tax=Actinacidiphila glaucinigra TaxID=235986 RepID=UPI002E303C3A|nr:S1 family peptidase [Actinacidiphila glaucinigra]